jgi:hypothetical protein
LTLDPDVADDMDAAEYFGTATAESSHSDLEYDYMVVDLLDMIDSNYSLYLASEVSLLIRYKGKLVIDDGESSSATSWDESFQQYQNALMGDLEN